MPSAVTEPAIACLELSLEVDAPDIVGVATGTERTRTGSHPGTPAPRLDQPVLLQDRSDGAWRRPRDVRPVLDQPRTDRDRSPQRNCRFCATISSTSLVGVVRG